MITATYSPDDNKLRLYASSRLDKETFDRVKAAGFRWAPKQDLFFSVWTPHGEDLAKELAGEIEDEDKSLVERAEERAERFEDYSDKRAEDAKRATEAVKQIADGIPFGQPILVGHHSERKARKDAERIQRGMEKAVKAFETSGYWTARAEGAIRAAKYKERPDVRARRIKGLEADKRKRERAKTEAERSLKMWSLSGLTLEQGIQIANRCWLHMPLKEGDKEGWTQQPTAYDALTNSYPSLYAPRDLAEVIDHAKAHYPKIIAHNARWVAHYENRLAYERAMLEDAGGTIAQKTPAEKGGAVRCWASPRGGWSYVQKVNRISVSVLDNWGNGGGNFPRTIPFDKLAGVMTADEVKEAREAGRLHETSDGVGFFLTGAPPEKTPEPSADDAAPEPKQDIAEAVDAMRQSLKAGVQVAVAPQLFETPADLAARMVDEADIQPGHRVLEPSAGTGRLIAALPEGVTVWAIEVSEPLSRGLWERFHCGTLCRDFLQHEPDELFDRVIMNPPFAGQADIKHVNHALKFLKPGGRLVAIMSAGVTFRQDRLATEFREMVERLGGTIEPLPAGTFKESGTEVSTVLVVIDAEEEKAELATEPTEQGNQYVMPGCEKDKSRGPNQMDLF